MVIVFKIDEFKIFKLKGMMKNFKCVETGAGSGNSNQKT